jgi:fibronectin type 3 domain-containing protein
MGDHARVMVSTVRRKGPRFSGGLGRAWRVAWLFGGVSACASGVPNAWIPRAEPPMPERTLDTSSDLSPPKDLRAHSGALRSVPLKWEPVLVGDVGGYAIERSHAREGPFERVGSVAERFSTEWIDRGSGDPGPVSDPGATDASAGLLDGVTRYYRVRTFAREGQLSDASAIVAATTAQAPAPPESLRSYSHQPRQIPLSWKASLDSTVSGYIVYRSPTSGGPFEELARVSERFETIYVDRDLGDLRVFYYGVSAFNAAGGEGAISGLVRGVTKPEPLPPFEVRVVEQRLGVNRLACAPNVEADIVEYRLLRRRAGADAPEVVAVLPPGQTHAEDDAVMADELIDYSLVAVDRDGLESVPSTPLTVRGQGYELTATVKRDGVHLRFNMRMDEGYHRASIQRRGVFGYSDIGVSYDGAFVDPNVEGGNRYEYTATLQRTDGTSGPTSAPVSIRVPRN